MNNIKNFKGGNRGGFRGGDRGDRDSRGPVTMHSAVCSSCGKTCEVPFRPTGEKPVYCRDCFAGRSAMGGDRSDRKDFRKENREMRPIAQGIPNNDGVKRELETVNSKLERLINSVENLAKILAPAKVVEKVVTEATPKIEVKMKKRVAKK